MSMLEEVAKALARKRFININVTFINEFGEEVPRWHMCLAEADRAIRAVEEAKKALCTLSEGTTPSVSDGDPKGEDPKELSAKHASAVPEGQTPFLTSPLALDEMK